MIEIKSPDSILYSPHMRTVFLAGSTEMGKAEPWQEKLMKEFKNSDIVFFNPRRDDWDSSWNQDINDKQFNEQVTWELSHLENVNKVIFYFDGNSQSPITLLELGYTLGNLEFSKRQVFVYCPDNYFRKGNVDIICARKGVKVFSDYDLFLVHLKVNL